MGVVMRVDELRRQKLKAKLREVDRWVRVAVERRGGVADPAASRTLASLTTAIAQLAQICADLAGEEEPGGGE